MIFEGVVEGVDEVGGSICAVSEIGEVVLFGAGLLFPAAFEMAAVRWEFKVGDDGVVVCERSVLAAAVV